MVKLFEMKRRKRRERVMTTSVAPEESYSALHYVRCRKRKSVADSAIL